MEQGMNHFNPVDQKVLLELTMELKQAIQVILNSKKHSLIIKANVYAMFDRILKMGKKSFDLEKTIMECFQMISFNVRGAEVLEIITSPGFKSFSHHFSHFLENGELSIDLVSVWIIVIKSIENEKWF